MFGAVCVAKEYQTGAVWSGFGFGSRGGYRRGCRGCSSNDGDCSGGGSGLRIDSLGSIPRRYIFTQRFAERVVVVV
ncbi:unnamed protein product [Cuscuta campestris]|uniref:Uncharacterized protein n=1 Tax=Cuscuta campestris TaxID=132261 RepID=A0A484KQA7_9ASTE|nr:unnamed protein product [Cuscuta campestris]